MGNARGLEKGGAARVAVGTGLPVLKQERRAADCLHCMLQRGSKLPAGLWPTPFVHPGLMPAWCMATSCLEVGSLSDNV